MADAVPNSSEAVRERSGVVASLLAEKGETLLYFFHGSLGSLDWRLSALEGGGKNFTLAIGLRQSIIVVHCSSFRLFLLSSCTQCSHVRWVETVLFLIDRRSAWAGLMLLATGSHSQQRCSTTTKGVKIKQWKGHACCYCIIALLSSIHLCSGYSFNLRPTHSANYALTWSTKIVHCFIVHYRYSDFTTAMDYYRLHTISIFFLLLRLILFFTKTVLFSFYYLDLYFLQRLQWRGRGNVRLNALRDNYW